MSCKKEKAERVQKNKLIVVILIAFGGCYYAFDRPVAPEYKAISVVLVAGLRLWFASRGFWPPIPPDCLFCKRDTDARFNAVPIAIAQVADRSQLGAMNRENISAEIRFRAKPSRLPVLECTIGGRRRSRYSRR